MVPVKEALDKRKTRSRIRWQILRTIGLHVGAPVVAAEVLRAIVTLTPRGLYSEAAGKPCPSWSYNYLYRMAEEGLLKLERLRGKLRLYLTPAGRRQLSAYDAYWRSKKLNECAAVSAPTEDAISPENRNRQAKGGQKTRRQLKEIIRQVIRGIAHSRRRRQLEGSHRTRAFVSYDIPQSQHKERIRILKVLSAAQFKRMHASMYVGPVAVLRPTVEAVESLGLLPFVKWGTITELRR
jgi:hypothetical protein